MRISFSSRKGFTLIELLVVISIISLLSSVIIAALTNVRKNAAVAAGEEFATYLYHTQSNAAIWNFNEGGSNPALDISGNNNTLNLIGATRTINTYNGSGYALQITGNQYADISTPNNLPTGSNMTVEAWIYPTSYASNTYIGIVSWGPRTSADSFFISINGTSVPQGVLSMGTWGDDAPSSNSGFAVSAPASVIPLNVWSNVAVSLNGNKATLYVNGAKVDLETLPYTPNIKNTGPLLVGCMDVTSGRCIVGAIDDVAIYTQSLSDAQIQEQYAEGIAKHLAIGQ